MAPVTRPSSPYTVGSKLLRTRDGKLMPIEMNSKLQLHKTTLLLGPMGTGKSNAIADENIALIQSPGLTELPFISILDIGPSSKGLISLIRAALPKEKRHFAVYERLQNTKEYCINVFDTRLGLRYPLSNQKAFIKNFISFLATPDDADKPPDGVSGIADALIMLAYKTASDRKTANHYVPGAMPRIDEALAEYNFSEHCQRKIVLWWDVVDFLYKSGNSHLASMAQRLSVPTLRTIASLLADPSITSIYKGTIVRDTQEPLPAFVKRKIMEAQNGYPLISDYTRFDIGEARVISLDLNDVAKGTGPDAMHRTGLMYMLAYHVLTNHFFTGPDHLAEMQANVGIFGVDYRKYHADYIDSISKLPKRFCIDEKHRVADLTDIDKQMDQSIFEGRKWGVEILQASQLVNAFSDAIVQLATNIWILGAGTKNNIDEIARKFKLSPSMIALLTNDMRKPAKKGATVIGIIDTERGVFEHHMLSTKGPIFLWAVNTNRDDSFVRDRLYELITEVEARKLLVELYPSGNLDEEITKRRKQAGLKARVERYQMDSTSAEEEERQQTPDSILNAIIDEIVFVHGQRHQARLTA